MKPVRAIIPDDETVQINGISLRDRSGLTSLLKNILADNPDTVFVIEPEQRNYYRAIGMFIYASQFAGISVDNIRFKVENGEVIPISQLAAV